MNCNAEQGRNGPRTPAGAARRAAGVFPLLLVALALVFPRGIHAQPHTGGSRRYLLIVETSKAMERRTAGLAQVVGQLVSSGFNRDVRSGDTLGIWTFNSQLFTGQFRLQRFAADTQPLAIEVQSFLKGQAYVNNPQWNQVAPALEHVVQNSSVLTIILVTAGTEAIQGTPFDAAINKAISSWREQQQAARMPVITVLRAHDGRITDWTVTAAPWPVEFPALPPEPPAPTPVAKATPTTKTNLAAPKTAAPPPMAAPLIVIGKKPEPIVPAPSPITNPATSGAVPTQTVASVTPVAPAMIAAAEPVRPAAAVQPAPAPAERQVIEQSAPKPAPDSTAPTPTTSAPAAASANTQPAGGSPAAPAEPVTNATVTATEAVALPPVTPPRHRSMLLVLLAGGGLVAGVLSLLLFWKRSRPAEHVSLITHSLQRQHVEKLRERQGQASDGK